MRKRHVFHRDVLADPIYNSKVVTKLINRVMLDGKRGKAQTIVYKAFDMVQEKTNENPNEVFTKAMENVTPEEVIERGREELENLGFDNPTDEQARKELEFLSSR